MSERLLLCVWFSTADDRSYRPQNSDLDLSYVEIGSGLHIQYGISSSGKSRIEGGICTQNYGYIVETGNYRYALRCNPQPGDYQIYLTAFDLRVQEMNMKQEQQDAGGMQMGGMNL